MSGHDHGRFRRIYSIEFLSSAFRSLDNDQRVVWLYCKAGPQSTSVGIYRLSTALACEELGNLTSDEFETRFAVVCETCAWRFDPGLRVLWMPEWLGNNPPQSPNVVVSWRKLLNNVPDCAIKAEAVDAIHNYLRDQPDSFRKAFGSYRVSLSEDVQISKAKPKAYQGSGIRGSGIRGARGAGTGNERDDNGRPKIDQILREASQYFGDGKRETKLDAIWDVLRRRNPTLADSITNSQVIAALEQWENVR